MRHVFVVVALLCAAGLSRSVHADSPKADAPMEKDCGCSGTREQKTEARSDVETFATRVKETRLAQVYTPGCPDVPIAGCAEFVCAQVRGKNGVGYYAKDQAINYKACTGLFSDNCNKLIVVCAYRRLWNASTCQSEKDTDDVRVIKILEVVREGCDGTVQSNAIENWSDDYEVD